MDKTWLLLTLLCTSLLLGLLKGQEVNSLQRFFRYTPKIKLSSFQAASAELTKEEKSLLGIWESIITGRTSGASKEARERYQDLALMHLFTPSGFHLSTVTRPVFRLLKNQKYQFAVLLSLGVFILILPGLGALKRMVFIKWNQTLFGRKLGFLLALAVDCFWGSFSTSPLSFSYSLLFLGIIYSGLKGMGLVIWFFIAQVLIAYFREEALSPLLLVFSPVLNGFFGLVMPLLFALAFPLWQWQLRLGLWLLGLAQSLVDTAYLVMHRFPLLEVNCGTLLILALLLYRRPHLAVVCLIFWTNSLNLDHQKQPSTATYEFRPSGYLMSASEGKMIFSDGKCRRKLIRGFWWEKCSPHRRALLSFKKL